MAAVAEVRRRSYPALAASAWHHAEVRKRRALTPGVLPNACPNDAAH